MNVDQNEVNKFAALASRWWDPEGEFKPLHELNPLRLEFIAAHTPLTGRKVLDVGCGGGILSEAMAQSGAEVTGIDMAAAALDVAKLHLYESKLKVDYRCITVEDLALAQPHSFDIITCMEMLEHVPDPASIIRACATLCKPGGKLFFSTLNRNFKAFMLAIVGAEYVMQMLPRGTHEYQKFIKPAELSHWLRECELNIIDSTGIHYQPLKRQYALSNKLDVNYIICAQKPC